MFFSLSTTPVKQDNIQDRIITRKDRLITFAILTIWFLLILFAVISLTRPQWLVGLSQEEKIEEAMKIKRAGDRFLEKNEFNKAATQYNAALIKHPDLYSALGNLAIVYSKTGNYKKATSILMKMIELRPELSYITETNLAEIFENTSNLDKAIEYYRKAALKAPFPSHLYTKLGNLYCKTDQCSEAVEAFRTAIIGRSDIESYYQGMLERDHHRISDKPETQEKIKLLLDNGIPENEMDRFDLTVFNLELLRDKEYAISFNNLGWAYELSEQPDKALESYNNAIKLQPRYLQARNNRDALKQKMENQEVED
ncbi:tetratricopeptide repeat protein [Candidatus Cloacimonadota bacterium]